MSSLWEYNENRIFLSFSVNCLVSIPILFLIIFLQDLVVAGIFYKLYKIHPMMRCLKYFFKLLVQHSIGCDMMVMIGLPQAQV